MMKHKKLIIGLLILCIAVASLVYLTTQSSLDYYDTVSELKAQGASIYGEKVRVHGEVIEGTTQHDGQGRLLFVICDEQNEEETLNVVYEGREIHTLSAEDRVAVTAEGMLDSDQVFYASKLLIACASKYEAN